MKRNLKNNVEEGQDADAEWGYPNTITPSLSHFNL